MTKRQLLLEDGTVFLGEGFGAAKTMSGEIIFNTSMTGYQEIISDPAYYGQIVMLTYPLVGNYGINRDDFEAVNPLISGLVVKEVSKHPSNFRVDETLDDYLKAHDIPGIAGIDTRRLMRHIRRNGTLKGSITTIDQPVSEIVAHLQDLDNDKNLVKEIAIQKPYVIPGRGKRVVVVDLGMKHGILRSLTNKNCHITVVPYNYTAQQILRLKPDGIVITSGPGNPNNVPETIAMVKDILGKIPLFSIGLGHQIFALASGAKVEKMAMGHHGASYPVKDLCLDRTMMTTQNHQFEVVKESLEKTELHISHININDQTIEGLQHKSDPAFSVQFYPEGTPGQDDATYIFDDFFQMMTNEVHANDY